MPVTTRSGLRSVNRDSGTTSRTEEPGYRQRDESPERPEKRRRTAVNLEDQEHPGGRASGSPICFASQAGDHRESRPTRAEIPEPETPPPRTPPRRGRYLGQVLGTGRRVLTTPSPRSVRNRPPTPYPRRLSLPRRGSRRSESGQGGDGWEPSIVIGRSLGENLSRAETARRAVRQWEAIYEHTLRQTPDAVEPIVEQLEDARRELREMDMTEENNTPT